MIKLKQRTHKNQLTTKKWQKQTINDSKNKKKQ